MNIEEKTLNNFLVRCGFSIVNINKRYKYWGLKYYIGGETTNIFLEQYLLNGDLDYRWYCNDKTISNLNLRTRIDTLEKDLFEFIETIRISRKGHYKGNLRNRSS